MEMMPGHENQHNWGLPIRVRKMDVDQLEEYGRTIGIEIDRRLTKSTILTQLEEHLNAQEETPIMSKKKKSSFVKKVTEALAETVKEVSSSTVLLRDKSTGQFSQGNRPEGNTSQSGSRGGEPFWEV
jgi:phenylpyruvate tautomerase PptA (4-oxalocrotonate tautomerase family)